MKLKIPLLVNKTLSILESNGFQAYVVGGAVRNMLMGLTADDWDFTTNAQPAEIQKFSRRASMIINLALLALA